MRLRRSFCSCARRRRVTSTVPASSPTARSSWTIGHPCSIRKRCRHDVSRYAADLDAIRARARRLAPFAHRTPVTTCATLDRLANRQLLFKCEHLQRVGAFKFRGACNAVMQLSDADAARGVVTHSSGNHAQALALAARLRGIPAHIVMPRTASAVQRRAVEEYGGQITECEPNHK